MSTDHDDHAAHGHDDHAPPPAPAAVAPPAPPQPVEPPPNPATRSAELGVLQACFHLATRSLFVYFEEPGALLALTPEDNRLEAAFKEHVAEDGEIADRAAALVRERHTEPQARSFPPKFTGYNYIPYRHAAHHFVEDLATHVAALERLAALLPQDATPSVRALVEQFKEERLKHLAFWSEEHKNVVAAAKAQLEARSKAAAPAKKH